MTGLTPDQAGAIVAAARAAAGQAYAPYSGFAVGAALQFADGSVVTGCNVENASYGLSLCAEAVAVATAMQDGHRGGLVGVAVAGGGAADEPLAPCGRCRQMLHELASLDGRDPTVLCCSAEGVREVALSALLPLAFGPVSLAAAPAAVRDPR